MDQSIWQMVLDWLRAKGIAPEDVEVIDEVAREAADDIPRSRYTLKKYISAYKHGKGGPSQSSAPADDQPEEPKDPRFEQARDPEDVSPDDLGVDPPDDDRPPIIKVASKWNPTYVAVMDFERREYLFDFDDEEVFDVPFDHVQQWIEWYTYKGLGMTQAEVARESQLQLDRPLTETYFQWCLKALAVNKKSTPFAPHMFYERSPQQLVQGWREQDEAMVEQKYRINQVRYLERQNEKLTHRLNTFDTFVKETVAMADLEAEEVDLSPPTPFNINENTPDYTPGFLLSDWHFGKCVDLDENQYNKAIAEERVDLWLEMVYDHMRNYARPYDRIVLFFLGDMIDGPMGDMHPMHWMRQDVHGRKQCVGAARLMARAAQGIYSIATKPVYSFAVAGNHGRSRKNRDEDPIRLAESLTYEIAAAKSSNVRWRIFDGEIGQTRIRNTTCFMSHGSKTPKDIRKVGHALYDENVLCLSGHTHADQRDGFSDKHVVSVSNGALCGVDTFERNTLAKAYRPSQTMVEIYDHGPNYGRMFYLDDQQAWKETV